MENTKASLSDPRQEPEVSWTVELQFGFGEKSGQQFNFQLKVLFCIPRLKLSLQ